MARYALVIGISRYEDEHFPMLSKAYTDAHAVAKVLRKDKRYKNVKLLTEELTRAKLGNELQQFILQEAVSNEALIYFTGHGFLAVDPDELEEPEGYLATEDCSVMIKGDRVTNVSQGGLSFSWIRKILIKSSLQNLVLLLDTCHSGAFLGGAFLGQDPDSRKVFGSKTDYYLIAASRDFQKAIVNVRENHSVFTDALLKGLSPSNADKYGAVTVDRLFDFIYTSLHSSLQEPFRLGLGRSIVVVQHDESQFEQRKVEPKRDINGNIICPYQGLRVFSSNEREFFFGRNKLIDQIKKTLNETHFIPIIGTSGSGKSSVVQAGLIPWLEEEKWQILDLVIPGAFPLEELRGAFKSFFKGRKATQLKALIENADKYPQGLISLIEKLPVNPERFLLIVDQFEEVFTVCANEQAQKRFIDLLTQAAKVSDSRFKVIATMRVDFLEPCLRFEKLHQYIQTQAVFMPPLTGVDLEDVIVKPAKRQGHTLEKALVSEIRDDVGKEPGFLPLLEFALTKLWEKRDPKKKLLTLEAYNKIGRLTGALNLHAERVYKYQQDDEESPGEARSQQQQEWIRRIFLRLLRTGEGTKDTRQRQPKAKLLSIAGSNSKSQKQFSQLIENLVNSRLLVTGRAELLERSKFPQPVEDLAPETEVIDLAHEALIEGWKRFAEWRQEDRDLRRLSDRLEDNLKVWKESGQKKENLMMGGLLNQVRSQWDELQQYLQSPQEDEDF
ncbi:MAG: caspase family protein [Cyanobacteria bacterium J06592_8]